MEITENLKGIQKLSKNRDDLPWKDLYSAYHQIVTIIFNSVLS